MIDPMRILYRSIAASFALLVYDSAWLKVHHPEVFVCALLNAQPMGFYSASSLVKDAQRHQVEVRPVSITESCWDATLEPPAAGSGSSRRAMRLGFRLVKGMSQAAGEAIMAARSEAPFVVVNCGAIPATLIQSELFGHEKGAFTGADRQRRGLIESANHGTLFLDEIGDLPLDMQTNLLRFLQEGTIDRVGGTRAVQVDVRVIAATHVDLEAAVASGAFRKDLYYRLNVLPLSAPPLRERGEDIGLLAQHYFGKFSGERGSALKGFSRRAMQALAAHDWPGNVRELVNRIRRAMVLAEGRLIDPVDLGLEPAAENPIRMPLDEARLEAERHAIAESLQFAGKNVSHAAKQLRISRMTLYRLMAKHRITA